MKQSFLAFLILCVTGCGAGGSAPFNSSAFNVSGNKHLYVASGSCYGGGVTTTAGPTNTISKYNLETGTFEQLVIDYNQLAPGDSPVSIQDYDADRLLVLVENTSGRRIDLVNKDGSGASTYLVNSTALNGVMRAFVLLADLSILVSKSTAVEKFNSAKARVMQGANPYISAPAAACATSTTLISSIAVHSSGKIVYTHANTSPNNKLGVVSASGYATAADCLATQAAPTTAAYPTRAIFLPNGKLLVSYGSTTIASNFIYSYDFNGTTGAISNAIASFNDGGTIVNGPSTMAVDPDVNYVYVANVTSTYNTIERFNFANNVLTRAGSQSFIPYGAYTRCISDMKVMN